LRKIGCNVFQVAELITGVESWRCRFRVFPRGRTPGYER
jgi:hypothetical protein